MPLLKELSNLPICEEVLNLPVWEVWADARQVQAYCAAAAATEYAQQCDRGDYVIAGGTDATYCVSQTGSALVQTFTVNAVQDITYYARENNVD
jgi:hypothetical protein